MGKKVFISFLGSTKYEKLTYKYKGRELGEFRFVQEALITKGVIEPNCDIYIFTTGEGKTQNWEGNNYIDEDGDCLKGKISLITDEPSVIKSNNDFEYDSTLKTKYSEWIWYLFSCIFQKIPNDCDVLHLDITYAFRSVPFITNAIIDFFKCVKNKNIKISVYYASVDQSLYYDSAEIINLSDIIKLQEYTRLASDFKKYGRVKGLGEQYDDTNAIRETLINFDNYIQFNNLAKIKEGAYLRTIFANDDNDENVDNDNNPLEIITENLCETLQNEYGFVNGDDWKNIEAAILWCQQHEMFIQAFSLAREYVNLRVSKIVLEKYNALYSTNVVDTNNVNDLTNYCLKKFDISGIMGIVDKIQQGKDPNFVRTINNSNNQFKSILQRINNLRGIIASVSAIDENKIVEIERHITAIETKQNEIESNLNYYSNCIVPATDNSFKDKIVHIISDYLDETNSWLTALIQLYTSKDMNSLVLTNMRNNLDHCKSYFSQNDYESYKNYDFKALFNLLPSCS